MSTEKNFSIERPGVKFTATAVSQAFDMTNAGAIDPNIVKNSEDVMVYNPGPNTIYVQCGDATTVALAPGGATVSMPVPPSQQTFAKGHGTYMAAISPSGNQDFYVFSGSGI